MKTLSGDDSDRSPAPAFTSSPEPTGADTASEADDAMSNVWTLFAPNSTASDKFSAPCETTIGESCEDESESVKSLPPLSVAEDENPYERLASRPETTSAAAHAEAD